jgi:hypothetical protein
VKIPRTTRQGEVALPFWRRQWKMLVAIMDDHPLPFIIASMVLAALVAFYAVPLRGASHCLESFRRWKLEMVGGEYVIDRGVRIYDVMLSIEPEEHDRADLVSMGGVPLVGSAFRSDIETLVGARAGKLRFLALDPRVSDPKHPSFARFEALALALGYKPWEFRASVWHAAAVLLRMHESLGAGFEIRFVTGQEGVEGADGFVAKPWVSLYGSGDRRKRMDLVAADPGEDSGEDYSARPAHLIVDRPDDPEVVELGKLFEEWWEKSTVLDATLQEQLMARLEQN